jgi:hypothetical protein
VRVDEELLLGIEEGSLLFHKRFDLSFRSIRRETVFEREDPRAG